MTSIFSPSAALAGQPTSATSSGIEPERVCSLADGEKDHFVMTTAEMYAGADDMGQYATRHLQELR